MPKKEIKELDFNIERDLETRGYGRICGIDEAGRGPLCGPVVAAACVLPMDAHIEGLNDSKKLTPQKRDLLFDIIKATAYDYAIAEASVEEIDEHPRRNAPCDEKGCIFACNKAGLPPC